MLDARGEVRRKEADGLRSKTYNARGWGKLAAFVNRTSRIANAYAVTFFFMSQSSFFWHSGQTPWVNEAVERTEM
jgi:hypothetical protein